MVSRRKYIEAFSMLVLLQIIKNFFPWRRTSTIWESPSSKILSRTWWFSCCRSSPSSLSALYQWKTSPLNVIQGIDNILSMPWITTLRGLIFHWYRVNNEEGSDTKIVTKRNDFFGRTYKLQNVTFETSETFGIRLFKSSLLHSITAEGTEF